MPLLASHIYQCSYRDIFLALHKNPPILPNSSDRAIREKRSSCPYMNRHHVSLRHVMSMFRKLLLGRKWRKYEMKWSKTWRIANPVQVKTVQFLMISMHCHRFRWSYLFCFRHEKGICTDQLCFEILLTLRLEDSEDKTDCSLLDGKKKKGPWTESRCMT